MGCGRGLTLQVYDWRTPHSSAFSLAERCSKRLWMRRLRCLIGTSGSPIRLDEYTNSLKTRNFTVGQPSCMSCGVVVLWWWWWWFCGGGGGGSGDGRSVVVVVKMVVVVMMVVVVFGFVDEWR